MSLEIVHDIETLGKSSDAIILTLGAVLVDTDDGSIKDSFYCRIKTDTQPYRTTDRATSEWWERQSFAAHAEAFGKERRPFANVIAEYNEWLQKYPSVGIWGNGRRFDNGTVQHAFDQCNIPWPFRRDCCLRSLRCMVGGDKLPWPDGLTKHIAIDDARYEAAELTELMRRWKSSTFTAGAEAMRTALLEMIDDETKRLRTTQLEIPESFEHCRQSLELFRGIRTSVVAINLPDSGVTS